jgi:hypothetical protein
VSYDQEFYAYPEHGAKPEACVNILREMLARAERGEIDSFCLVACGPKGERIKAHVDFSEGRDHERDRVSIVVGLQHYLRKLKPDGVMPGNGIGIECKPGPHLKLVQP